jgi:hypothetical protein
VDKASLSTKSQLFLSESTTLPPLAPGGINTDSDSTLGGGKMDSGAPLVGNGFHLLNVLDSSPWVASVLAKKREPSKYWHENRLLSF